MKKFKDIVMKVPLEPEDIYLFDDVCRSWEKFCYEVSILNKLQLIKLMKYLLKYRPNSTTYLKRVIAKFNAVNRLTLEDLK